MTQAENEEEMFLSYQIKGIFYGSKALNMKRARKRKSDMTSSEEYTGVNIFKQDSLLFEGGYHFLYEEACISLPFRKQNGENQDKRENYQENTLGSSEADTLAGERGKMRENCMGKKNNLDGGERQKSVFLNSMKPENRGKLSFSYSVEFAPVSGLFGVEVPPPLYLPLPFYL
jgi:hypothetical protein